MNPTQEQLNARIRDSGMTPYTAPIPVTSLGTSLNTSSLPTVPNNTSLYNTAVTGAIAGAVTPTTTTPTPEKPVAETPAEPTGFMGFLSKYLPGGVKTTAPVSTVNTYNKLAEEQGLTARQKEVNDLTAQLNEINASTTAGQLALETKDVSTTQGIVDRKASQLARENAIKALPITAALNAAQGRLDSARSNISTMLSLIQKDNEAKYQYDKDQIDMAMTFANADQKDALQKRSEQLAKDKAEADRLAELRKTYVDAAIKVEDFKTAGKLASATSVEDLQTVGSTISSKVPDVQIVESGGGIYSVNKKTGSITTLKASTDAGGTPAAKSIQQASAQGNIDLITTLTTDKYLTSAVGPNTFARTSFTNMFTGGKTNFIAGIEQLRSQLTLDSLINAKAKGATFGALSEGELKTLSQSASKLGTWAIKDKDGNVTGYNAKEGDFKKELDKINNFAKLDFIIKGGDPASINVVLMPNGKYVTKNSDGTVTELN